MAASEKLERLDSSAVQTMQSAEDDMSRQPNGDLGGARGCAEAIEDRPVGAWDGSDSRDRWRTTVISPTSPVTSRLALRCRRCSSTLTSRPMLTGRLKRRTLQVPEGERGQKRQGVITQVFEKSCTAISRAHVRNEDSDTVRVRPRRETSQIYFA